MEYSVESFCEPGFQYIKNYPSRLKSFISESEADVYDFIESELNVWEPVLDFIEDQSRLNEKKAYPIFYENLQKAINLLTEQMVSFYTSKKIGFLNEKKIAMKLKNRNPSTDNLMGLLKNINNAQPKFYVAEPSIIEDLPKDDKNNPLTFFEYIFDNGGLEKLICRIAPTPDEIITYGLIYVEEEFAYYTGETDHDTGEFEFVKTELSDKLKEILNAKLMITRKLIEDRMGDFVKDESRTSFLKLIITKLLHLDHAITKMHIKPMYNLNKDIFKILINHLSTKYDIYIYDETRKRINQNNQTVNNDIVSSQTPAKNPAPDNLSQNIPDKVESSNINKNHYLYHFKDHFKKTILHLSESAADYITNYPTSMADYVSFFTGKNESDYINLETEFWNKVISDLERPEELLDGVGYSGLLDDLKYLCEKDGYDKLFNATNDKLDFLKSLTNNNPIPEYHLKKYMTEDQWKQLLKWLKSLPNDAFNSDGTTNNKYRLYWLLHLLNKTIIKKGYVNYTIKIIGHKTIAMICNVTFKPKIAATELRSCQSINNPNVIHTSLPTYQLPTKEKK